MFSRTQTAQETACLERTRLAHGERSTGVQRILPLVALCCLVLSGLAPAQLPPWNPSDIPRPDTWVTDGGVVAAVRTSDTVYIGGEFTYVGPHTGCGVPLDLATGLVAPPFPKVSGPVDACVPDGSGGWFVGGWFSHVGGLARHNLAHIRADGTADPAWDVLMSPYSEVYALALSPDGSTLYVGGWFWSIGGEERYGLVAVDASTGELTDWDPDVEHWYYGEPVVGALAVSPDGSTLYAGGWFTYAGGADRDNIAALDTATGLATPWNPDADEGVYVLALSQDGATLYAGGDFSEIGGEGREHIAALDTTTGNATAWDPDADDDVCAIAPSGDGSTVYVGGDFEEIGGKDRDYIAALDATTGQATDWDPDADDEVYALALSGDGSTVYVGGDFEEIGGEDRLYIAALDVSSAEALDWNPVGANDWVECLGLTSSTLYVGGAFSSMGGLRRNNIAALDAETGAATDWDPDATSEVRALAVSPDGSTVYAGGFFSEIGGAERDYIAALDAATGLATAWNPGANDGVLAIELPNVFALEGKNSAVVPAPMPEVLYVGGYFTHIGGEDRNYIAALDPTTDTATPWNPNANGAVWDIEVGLPSPLGGPGASVPAPMGVVYAAGSFSSIGEAGRPGLAALDMNGLATIWHPNPDGWVYDLEVGFSPLWGPTVFVGGDFYNIGGSPHYRIAALDTALGGSHDWCSGAEGSVYALAAGMSQVYVGGDFYSIGGQEREYLAALDLTTGEATDWNPNPGGLDGGAEISCIAPYGPTVYVGGWYDSFYSASYYYDALGADRVGALADNFRVEVRHYFAEFGPAYTVRFETDGTPGAVIQGASVQTVMEGEDCSPVTALAPVDYVFSEWTEGEPEDVQFGLDDSSTNPLTVTNVTEDMTFTANFIPRPGGIVPDRPREETWLTDGPVYAIARTADTIYLGGRFDYVGPRTGGFVALDAADPLPTPTPGPFSIPFQAESLLSSPTLAKVNGNVYACAPDGKGGWFVGGWFDKVGEENRDNLAHILADGTLDAAWNVPMDSESEVYALVVSPDGSTLYVGGDFDGIGGEERDSLAALDPATGVATDWAPDLWDSLWGDPEVYCLQVSEDGSTLYIGGWFSDVGEAERSYLAAIDAETGAPTAWNPSLNDWVSAIDLYGTTLYASGHFTTVGEESRNRVAAIDVATGNATAWDPALGGEEVSALAVSPDGSIIYIGGWFWQVGEVPRYSLAAIDSETGLATDWNPDAEDSEVCALALSPDGSILYVGGGFEAIDDEERSNIAALDTSIPEVDAFSVPGGLLSWDPKSEGVVECLAVSGSKVYAGGRFASVGGVIRHSIAALDAQTGAATAWNPNTEDWYHEGEPGVYALAASPDGSTIYVGGWFTAIGEEERWSLAALDAHTGYATSWDPDPYGYYDDDAADIYALAVSPDGSTVYVGGWFDEIGDEDRYSLAAIDASSGYATSWDPDPDKEWDEPEVYALAVSPDGWTVYVGGRFDYIGGEERWGLAAVDAIDGDAADFDPDPEGDVDALALSNSALLVPPDASGPAPSDFEGVPVLYVGGDFDYIGGEERYHIAAVDPETGEATDWDPYASSNVYALAPAGPSVFAGGRFSAEGDDSVGIDYIGGTYRDYLAELDAESGIATVWNPYPDDEIYSLVAYGRRLYVGGDFSRIGGQQRHCFAEFRGGLEVRFETDGTPGAEIEGDEIQEVVLGGDCSPVRAVAPVGYRFVEWSQESEEPEPPDVAAEDDSSTNPLTVTNVTDDMTFIAHFSEDFSVSPPLERPREDTWVTDGPVYAISRISDTIYMGGDFRYVGPHTGGFAALSVATPAPTPTPGPASAPFGGMTNVSATLLSSPTLAKVNGDVYACAPDGAGGWYIGGWFWVVGGVERNNIAHILADGTVDPAWDPDADGDVQALAVSGDGSTLYVGGRFSNIGGQARDYIAALDATTGLATDWDPGANSTVLCLMVKESTPTLPGAANGDPAPSTIVYAGGWFQNIGGLERHYIAALDGDTGSATGWNPAANGAVYEMVVSGSTLYAGGGFSNIGGAARQNLAALDIDTGSATIGFSADANDAVNSLVVSGSTVYAGGWFDDIGGSGHRYLAALDAETGVVNDWDPDLDYGVNALALSGSILYAGGEFAWVGEQERHRLAAIDISEAEPGLVALAAGEALDWNPGANDAVYALAVSSPTLVVGGGFSSVGGVTRHSAAAVDASTGAATAWDPDVDGYVYALAVSNVEPSGVPVPFLVAADATVYIGGDFDGVSGEECHCLAAVDGSSGQLFDDWYGWANDEVWSLAVSPDGSRLYAAGLFYYLDGAERPGIGALDTATGMAIDWYPDLPFPAPFTALAASNEVVYAAGIMVGVAGGQEAPEQIPGFLLWIDAPSGEILDGGPLDGYVYDLALTDSRLYVGGDFYIEDEFDEIHNLFAIELPFSDFVEWFPQPSGAVRAIAPSGQVVFAGGDFASHDEEGFPDYIGGEDIDYLAALDTDEGEALPWNPAPDYTVYALATWGQRLYVGGTFSWFGYRGEEPTFIPAEEGPVYEGEKRHFFAEFRPEHTVQFETDETPGAMIEGETEQTVEDGTDCTSVTAVAPYGYLFVNWTRATLPFPTAAAAGDPVYSTDNPLTVTNVLENMLLTANFAIDRSVPTEFEWDTVTSPQVRAWPFPVGVTAKCVDGETVATAFTGPVDLSGWTPETLTAIGSATAPYAYPFFTMFPDVRTQVIYLQSELGGAKTLNGLALDILAPALAPLSNLTIRMKHTSMAEYASPLWEGPASGWTTVFYQPATTIPGIGEVWFNFTTPFEYNGTDNLFIDISLDNNAMSMPPCMTAAFWAGPAPRGAYNFTLDIGFSPLDWYGPIPVPPNLDAFLPCITLRGATLEVPIAPTVSGNFVNGVWTGDVTVGQVAEEMYLYADAGMQRVGLSNTFQVLQGYTLDAGVDEHGSLEESPDQPRYLPGTTVTLTVTPDEHYHFDSWMGDVPSGHETDNPLVLTMDDDKVVTATCAIDRFSVTFQTDGTPGCWIDGETTQTVDYGSDCSQVTAMPSEGYQFVEWQRDGGSYSGDNPLTVTNVTGNMTFVAVFACSQILHHFDWDEVSSPQVRAWPFPVGIAARCVHGHPIADYAGTATLEARTPDFVTTMGLGTDTFPYPFVSFGQSARTQALYRPSELGGAKTITALALDVTTVPTGTMNNWLIRMKHTDATDLSAGYEGPNSGWTTVCLQSVLSIPSTGWFWFELDTPFVYNGEQNVFIDFLFLGGTGAWMQGGYVRATNDPNRVWANWSQEPIENQNPWYWEGTYAGGYGDYSPQNLVPNILVRGYATIPIEPDVTGNFVDGEWEGDLTVNQSCALVFLRADDGDGHTGDSNLFEVLNAYTLQVGECEHCAVEQSLDQPSYLPGTTVTLTVTPDEHYHFDSWSGDVPAGEETRNPLVLVMDDDKVVTATCSIDQFTVTFETDGTPGASVEGETPQTIDYGSDCTTVTAVAPEGWHFRNWRRTVPALGISAPDSGPIADEAGPTTNPLTVTNVTEDAVWTAVFALDRHWVTFQTDGSPGATLTGETAQRVEYGSDCTTVTANPPMEWRFRSWKEGTAIVSTDSVLAVSNVTENMNFIAHFGPSHYRLWFYTDGTERASLSGPSPQLIEYLADSAPVEAIAPRGFHFDRWTVEGADFSTDNPLTVHGVDAGMTIVAEFEAIVSDVSRPGYSTDTLHVDKRLYNDRYSRFLDPIPSNLEGMVYIKTLNDDADLVDPGPGTAPSPDSEFFTFRLSEAATVYIAVVATQPLPAWLATWTQVSERLETSNVARRLLKKGFPAGTVSLGYNREPGMPDGLSMYNVIVVPLQTDAANWGLYE